MNVCYWNVLNSSEPIDIIAGCEEIQEGHDVDVFCLQEVPYLSDVDRTPASLAVASALGWEGHVFEPTREISPAVMRSYGTAIIGASGLIEVTSEVLREDRFAYMSPGTESRRVLLSATTEEEPDTAVAVAHLSNTLPLGIGRAGLLDERYRLISKLTGLKEQHESVVFGGDLNCEPTDRLGRDLHDSGYLPLDSGESTFRSRFWPTGYFHHMNFDRAFVTEELTGSIDLGNYGSSDHRPVIVKIKQSG